jgi:hypothetical protein
MAWDEIYATGNKQSDCGASVLKYEGQAVVHVRVDVTQGFVLVGTGLTP